jgi:transcriptional regulator with XRE-family HTH domain
MHMAKIKVRPQTGALFELLKKKGMSQMDAHTKTGVDRKTLLKINRGEEVKLETLQQVATKLQVPEAHFLGPPPAATEDSDDPSWLHTGTVMLRKLDASGLEKLLTQAGRPRWELNAHVGEDAARKFLEEFEGSVEKFWLQLNFEIPVNGETLSLKEQLARLKMVDDIAERLEQLAEHRLALLGGDFLFWECTETTYLERTRRDYRSTNTALLSIEPFGAPSRRVPLWSGYQGSPPPKSPISIDIAVVCVNGVEWETLEEM